MSEQEKRDPRDLATMLKDLPKEDRLQVQGVIAGMKLARNISAPDSNVENRREAAHVRLLKLDSRAFLEVGDVAIELIDYKITSPMRGSTELEAVMRFDIEIMDGMFDISQDSA